MELLCFIIVAIIIWFLIFCCKVSGNNLNNYQSSKLTVQSSIREEKMQDIPKKLPKETINDTTFQFSGNINGYKILKYIGFNDETIIVPQTFNDAPIIEVAPNLFAKCTTLKHVIIEASITTISKDMFSQCKKLETVILPETLKAIKESAFSSCTNLRSLKIPSNVISIGSYCFYNSGLKSLCLPHGLKHLGASAFDNCERLTEIEIPSGVKTIAYSTFDSCTRLETVTLSEGLLNIENNAFLDCNNLNKILIPQSVQSIGEHVFYSSSLCQPDRRYNPFVIYEKTNITIYCHPGSYAQEFFRGDYSCMPAKDLRKSINVLQEQT